MSRGVRLLKTGALVIGAGAVGASGGAGNPPVDSPQLVAPDLTGRRRIDTFENPQAVIGLNPGGRFSLMPGVHNGRTINLSSSAYNNTDILAEPAAILDGQGANIECLKGAANGVTFRGWNNANRLVIRNYKLTSSQTTAVKMGAVDDSGSQATGWVMGYVDVQDAGQVALRVGNSCYLGFSRVLRSTQLGLAGGGISTSGSPSIIEYVTAEDCNTSNADPGFEGGASKFAVSHWLTIRNCTFIGNSVHASAHDGYGIWFDVDCEDYTVANCTVRDIPRVGVVVEISGKGTVHDNTITNCGFRWSTAFQNVWGFSFGAGIQICASGHGPAGNGLSVYNNSLTDCYEGIDILEQPRGRWQANNAYDHYSQDVQVNNNTLLRCGPSGTLLDIPLTWNSSTTYTVGSDPERNTSSHVITGAGTAGRIFRALQTGSNHTPPATNTDDAWWHFVAVVPQNSARALKWGTSVSGTGNHYTTCGASGSVLQGTNAPFYWPGSLPSFAQWQALGQDVSASGATFA
jgi:hypothetical protein